MCCSSFQEFLPKDWIMVLLLHFYTWCTAIYLLKACGIAYELCDHYQKCSAENQMRSSGWFYLLFWAVPQESCSRSFVCKYFAWWEFPLKWCWGWDGVRGCMYPIWFGCWLVVRPEAGRSFNAFLRRRKQEGFVLPENACFWCGQTATRKTLGEACDHTIKRFLLQVPEYAGSRTF